MGDGQPVRVSRRKAKALIDSHQYGTLVVGRAEPVDVIGTLDDEENQEYEHEVQMFAFGALPVGEPNE